MMTIKEFEIQNALGSLSYDIKIELAENKRTSRKMLTILSKDEYWYVRYWVTNNHSTPKTVLFKLCRDEDEDVKRQAMYNLKRRKRRI